MGKRLDEREDPGSKTEPGAPARYLMAIEQEHLLGKLFERVSVFLFRSRSVAVSAGDGNLAAKLAAIPGQAGFEAASYVTLSGGC